MSNANLEDLVTVPKIENSEDGSFSETSPEPDEQSFIQENAQVQKRKGGRKPIYATSEERKQRNRQAQAAFRERRTEYIKQLETTIKHHEDTLQNLQQSHRSAADECLMLRYKNSLLERILVEKGIDVQAELKSKTDEARMGPHYIPTVPGAPQPFPLQRSVLNRSTQSRRSTIGPMSKPLVKTQSSSSTIPKQSPQLQATPRSQTISPITAKSPTFHMQGGLNSPSRDMQAQQPQHPQHPQSKNRNQASRPHPGLSNSTSAPPMQAISPSSRNGSRSSEMGSTSGSQKGFYPSPYQTHIEQLGKASRPLEYDAHADMLEDPDPNEHPAGPGPYPQSFHHQSHPPGQQLPPAIQGQRPLQQMRLMHPPPTSQAMDPSHPAYGAPMNQIFDQYDPMLDADPFGLTAKASYEPKERPDPVAGSSRSVLNSLRQSVAIIREAFERGQSRSDVMDVKSKNLFEVLDNESDEDSDKEIIPTPKLVEKSLPRTSKRNGPDADPSDSWEGPAGGERSGRGGRRGGYGNDAAFNDRAAGSENNRGRPNDDRRGAGRGRAFRGGRGGARGDRHNRSLPNDHPRQADNSWGAQTGEAEWKDEQAGEAIAKADEAADPNIATAGGDAGGHDTPAVVAANDTDDPAAAGSAWNNDESATVTGTDWNNTAGENGETGTAAVTEAAPPQPAAEPEPEEQTKSYSDYLVEQAEKRAKLGDGPLLARKPNEGSKEDKKWAKAKPLTKDEENDAYIAAKSGKDSKENREKRDKPRKEKTRLDLDLRYAEPPGGRGGGDRGRGRGRGDYRGGERGRGRGRGGEYRGGRGDSDHYRGNRGGNQNADPVNVSDESAFPSLGGRS